MVANCRIGKVTPKASPHLSEILPRPRNNFRKVMHSHVDTICDTFPEGMAAELMIAIDFNGRYSIGWRIDEDSPYPFKMLPSIASELIRSEVTEHIARDVVEGEL